MEKFIELVRSGDITPVGVCVVLSLAIGLVVFSAYTGAGPK